MKGIDLDLWLEVVQEEDILSGTSITCIKKLINVYPNSLKYIKLMYPQEDDEIFSSPYICILGEADRPYNLYIQKRMFSLLHKLDNTLIDFISIPLSTSSTDYVLDKLLEFYKRIRPHSRSTS